MKTSDCVVMVLSRRSMTKADCASRLGWSRQMLNEKISRNTFKVSEFMNLLDKFDVQFDLRLGMTVIKDYSRRINQDIAQIYMDELFAVFDTIGIEFTFDFGEGTKKQFVRGVGKRQIGVVDGISYDTNYMQAVGCKNRKDGTLESELFLCEDGNTYILISYNETGASVSSVDKSFAAEYLG